MRKLSGIFLLSVIMGLSGCQAKQAQGAVEINPQKEIGNADPAETLDAEKKVNATGQETEKEKIQEEGTDLEIEIPKGQNLTVDYTSVSGLALEPGAHIAVVVMNPKSSYWEAVKKGMQRAIDDLNAKLGYTGDDKIYFTYEGPDGLSKAETQINIIDAVLAENPQALCIAAIDRNSCEAQLETAAENGIPVIILDSSVESENLAYTVCETDNYGAGTLAAQKLCEKIGDTGKVQIVAHLQDAETSRRRETGFRDEIIRNHPNVQVLDTIYEDTVKVEEALNKVFEKNPDVKGVFTTNENTGRSVLEYLDKKQLAEVQMVGFDAGAKQIEAIKGGQEYGVICQNPSGMGYVTIVAASRAILGLQNDPYIDSGYQWIDAANINDQKNKKFLYE